MALTGTFTDGTTGLSQNPYKFSAWRSAALNVGTAATKVTFETEEFDTGNNFDSVTNNNFTAPVAGFYHFESFVQVNSNASTTNGIIFLYKNGSSWKQGTITVATAVTYGLGISALLQLVAGDTVDVRISTAGAATSISNSQVNCWFMGFLISQT